jgi:hypothetical protein
VNSPAAGAPPPSATRAETCSSEKDYLPLVVSRRTSENHRCFAPPSALILSSAAFLAHQPTTAGGDIHSLGLRLVAVQHVQAGARLRIPHPAQHTHTPTPLSRPSSAPPGRTPVLIMAGWMRCCTRERRACGAQTARLSGTERYSNSPDSAVPRPRDEAHVPLGRHVRLQALHLPGVV